MNFIEYIQQNAPLQDRETLAEANRVIVQAMRNTQISIAATFRPGNKVEFNSSKGFGIVRGTVTKVNAKSIKVTDTYGRPWTVSPSLLRHQEPGREGGLGLASGILAPRS